MFKKTISLIFSVVMLLSIVIIPQGAITASAETVNQYNKVIQAAVKFTDGTAGTKKSIQIALYSLGLKYAPERLGLSQSYKWGSSTLTGKAPICDTSWSLKYDYAISDSVVGLGTIQVQEKTNWAEAGDPAKDHTDGLNCWMTETQSLASLGGSANYSKPLYALALSCITTAAVDTSKTYYAYYRNLQIVDGSGNTVYTLFDDSVTTAELSPERWAGSNATMELSVINNPYKVTTINTEKVIRADVQFTDGTEGTNKKVQMALYSLGLSFAPDSLDLTQDYAWGAATLSGKAPISSSDWSLKYDYAISDDISGFGTIELQEAKSWASAGDPAADHSDGLATWQTETVSVSNLGSAGWGKPLHAIALSCLTTAAVDTSKTYTAYYKNIRIEDADGNIVYKLFDDTLTTTDLHPQVWGTSSNASMELSVVNMPYAINSSETTNGTYNVNVMASVGETVALLATPDNGYRVGSVTVGENTVSKVSRNSYSFLMPALNVDVNVEFVSATKGDIDDTGVVDASDLVGLKKALIGGYSDYDEYSADVNSDDDINIIDLIRIKKAIVA